jgi:hypothetical protein
LSHFAYYPAGGVCWPAAADAGTKAEENLCRLSFFPLSLSFLLLAQADSPSFVRKLRLASPMESFFLEWLAD